MNGQAKQVATDWQAALHEEIDLLDAIDCAVSDMEAIVWRLKKLRNQKRAKVRRMERRNRVIVITP